MSENQRVRLSKQCLRESLICLLQQKSIHKVSVRELCDAAQINRTTFYKYYGSPYDLLADMEDEALARCHEHLGTIDSVNGNAAAKLHGLLTYAQDNLALFRLLINNPVDTSFLQRIINLPMIRQFFSEQMLTGYTQGELDYFYELIVNGAISMVKCWINKKERETPEEMTALLMKAISKLFA